MTARTYSIEELTRETGVSSRTVRHWVASRLLDPPEFRGSATRYSESQAMRVRAAAKLRSQNLGLGAIRKRLADATPAEMAKLAGVEPAASASVTAVPAPPAPTDYPASAWERVVLAPGLELHIDARGGPILRRIAQQIYEHYGRRDG